MLEKRLATLPSTLAETYSRILRNIPDDYRPNAIKILQFLTYSDYPISLEEAVDIIATDPRKDPPFEARNRMRKANETLLLCSSLVSPVTRILVVPYAQTEEMIEIHLAHSSVKEFLRSGTTRLDSFQQLKEDAARASIVQVCLAYLSSLNLGLQLQRIHQDYPLAESSATIWMSSAAAAESNEGAKDTILKFFSDNSRGYANWRRLLTSQYHPITIKNPGFDIQAPFYHVTLLGLYQTMEVLLQSKAHDPIQALDFSCALDAATRAGKSRMVELLLQHQQRFYNIQDEGFLSALNGALREASSRGYEQIVKILIHEGASVDAEGASVDAEGGPYDTALQFAAFWGHESVVRLLLDAGADINARGETVGTALWAATFEEREQIVQMLLTRGAGTAFKHKILGTALRVACDHNNTRIVGMLLENDVKNNEPGRCYAEELCAAAYKGHEGIVRLLLDRGAHLTFEVLLAFLVKHHVGIMEFMSQDRTRFDPLLPFITKDLVSERDAGNEKTLLHWAAEMGFRALADCCIELGAKVDTTDAYGETALHYAAENGHVDIVHLLVQANANRSIVDQDGLTALDSRLRAGS
jgi:ankyrin repeat protein